MSTADIVIVLDGGLVQDVLCDRPGVRVLVVDQDIEGMEEEPLKCSLGEFSPSNVFLAELAPDTVEEAFAVAGASPDLPRREYSPANWRFHLKPGMEVTWNDPDGGVCSKSSLSSSPN